MFVSVLVAVNRKLYTLSDSTVKTPVRSSIPPVTDLSILSYVTVSPWFTNFAVLFAITKVDSSAVGGENKT